MSGVPVQNLLPAGIRRTRILRDRLRRWGLLVGIVVVVLAGYATWHARSHQHAHARLETARTITADLLRMERETIQHRERINVVREQLAARERIVPTEDTLHVLDLVGRGHQRATGRLSVGKLTVERRRVEVVATGTTGKPKMRETTHIEVTGVALDDASLHGFVSTLRREATGGRVELQSGERVRVDGHEVRRYVVVCAFE